jgi:hypothetical protein
MYKVHIYVKQNYYTKLSTNEQEKRNDRFYM